MKVTSSGLVCKWNWVGKYKTSQVYRMNRGSLTKTGPNKGRYTTFIEGRRVAVHRLVCEKFHGPPPTAYHVVNHKNNNPSDNRPENLEWVTQKGNVHHAMGILGTYGRPPSFDIDQAKRLFEEGKTVREISNEMGVKYWTLHYHLIRKEGAKK